MKKRVLSLLLALVMALGLLPLTVLAASEPEARYQTEPDGEWIDGTLAAALGKVYEGGTVMLLKDFYITAQTGIPSITKPMTLTSYDDPDTEEREVYALTSAINGHPTLLMIFADARLESVIVDGGYDKDLVASGPLVLVQRGSLTLGDGACIQNNRNNNSRNGKNWLGGGVFLSGSMVMEPGSAIKNCRAWSGGGVAVVNSAESCLTLQGGSIEDCESYQGGGVAVFWGSLKLEAGQIDACRAVEPENESLSDYIAANTDMKSPGEGGGVFLAWDHSIMEMTGGAVTGNRAAKSGGGIGCDHGQLTLSGGEITKNQAQEYGGGVLASPMLKVSLSGNARITENKSGIAGFENLCLDGSEDWIGNQGGATATEPFVITGALQSDFAPSGLARWMAPDKDDPEHPERVYRVVAVPGEGYAITEADKAHFLSDDPRFVVRLMELDGVNQLVLTFPTVTYQDGLEGEVFPKESHLCTGGDDTPKFSGTPERKNYTFQGWLPEVSEKVTGDAVYTAQWALKTRPVVFDVQDHGAATAPEVQTVSLGDKVSAPAAPTEPGYDFGGWYKEAICETAWDFASDTVWEDRTEPVVLYAKWMAHPYSITYNLNGGENAADNPDSYTIETETLTLTSPVKEGHTFLGWTEDGEETPSVKQTIPQGSMGDRAYTAQWSVNTYPVTFDVQGHGAAPDEQSVSWNEKVSVPTAPEESGWKFDGWYKDAACETPWDFECDTVTEAVTLYAKWTKETSPRPGRPSRPRPPEEQDLSDTPVPMVPLLALEREEHFAYIVGCDDGTVRPEGHITRAEAATIFFRLMTEDFRAAHWSVESPFPDVGTEKWYHNTVSTDFQAGLIRGLPDGTFSPEREITRAEFAALAARFLSNVDAPDSGFDDLDGHWAKDEVDRAVAAGWIKGCDDGLFHPNEPMSRAQVMTLVNRMLGRLPAADGLTEDMLRWPDNPADKWYYLDVQEATNGHTYDRSGSTGIERWRALTENRDWTALER